MSSDAEILKEIKQYLATSSISSTKKLSKTVETSPYNGKIKKAPVRKQINSTRKRTSASSDELLDHYAALPKNNFSETGPEIRAKAIGLQFADTTAKSQEYVRLQDKFDKSRKRKTFDSDDSSQASSKYHDIERVRFEIANGTTTVRKYQIEKVFRKYPRFTSSLQSALNSLKDDGLELQIRNDGWLLKQFETCYDEAYDACCAPINKERWRMRNGFDLGSMDAFPLVAQRYFANKYSVLEVRLKLCLEFLVHLEVKIEKSDVLNQYDFDITEHALRSDYIYEGGRALLFSKFLSEEYDLDFVALFLEKRELAQRFLTGRFKDFIQRSVWEEEGVAESKQSTSTMTQPLKKSDTLLSTGPSTMARTITTGAEGRTINTATAEAEFKVIPVKLPQRWQFTSDLAFPEAPLVSFDVHILHNLVCALLPGSSVQQRQYCMSIIVEYAIRKCLRKFHASQTMQEKQSFAATVRNLSKFDIQYIPLQLVLQLLCEEWQLLSLESKLRLVDTGEAAASLRELNTLYDNDCEKIKAVDKEKADLHIEIGLKNSAILTMEKTLRKLERRWKNTVATAEELAEMQELKKSINTAKLERSDLESALKTIGRNQRVVQNTIDQLWGYATADAPPISTDRFKLRTAVRSTRLHEATSNWRRDVNVLFNKVLDVIMGDPNLSRRKEKETPLAEQLLTIQPEQLKAAVEAPVVVQESEESKEVIWTMIQVMAVVTSKKVVKEGVRKVLLREYLKNQEHELMLLYGGEAYLARERERKRLEEEERLRKRRHEIMLQVVRAQAIETTDLVVAEAKKAAAIALFDPWTLLDLDPASWLSSETLHAVERKFQVTTTSVAIAWLRYAFHFLIRPWKLLQLQRRRDRKMLQLAYTTLKNDMLRAKFIHSYSTRLQRLVRAFLYKCRIARHIAAEKQCMAAGKALYDAKMRKRTKLCMYYWSKQSSLLRRYKECLFCLKDRRFILTFYTWLHNYKIHKTQRMSQDKEKQRASVVIQCCVRKGLAYLHVRRIRAQWRIALLSRRYIARLQYQEQLQRRRLEDDRMRCVTLHRHLAIERGALKHWRKRYNLVRGFDKMCHAFYCDKYRKRFKKWIRYKLHRTRILSRFAVIIQSIIRMWIVKKTILHYYRWRRGMHGFQGLVRRRAAMQRFVVDIYYYRAARQIQRVYRGYYQRNHMTECRVRDIHYASAHNKYDRLRHYILHFPDLVWQYDADGNTALHNAARTASKRTLKLLVKFGLDPNALNVAGYSPLHLIIMSNSQQRDEGCLYMLEHGFDDEQATPDGKTSLLLAAEYGRMVIVQQLLEDGLDTNVPDYNGLTCLQTACTQGNLKMVQDFIAHDADVNKAGYGGTFPLHDCVASGNIEIAHVLFHQGAYVNVYDPVYFQTPLMWACQAGQAKFVRLYILQGADINAKDSRGQTAVHYAAASNSSDIYNALREADADFDVIDEEGNTSMHLAAQSGAAEFAIHCLRGGANPSIQNHRGDQPAHIAARYNQLEMLRQICLYDNHIGRVNYSHQTPLGVAKFHCSSECVEYLESHFRLVEKEGDRNPLGEIWWDRQIDEAVGDWETITNYLGERTYRNIKTGEISYVPPKMSASLIGQKAEKAELPLQRTIVLVKDENKITKHAYYKDFAEKEKEVALLSKDYIYATIIVKYARRKLAYMELARLREERRVMKILKRFARKFLPRFAEWRFQVRTRAAEKIQCAWRGHHLRKHYYRKPDGMYYKLLTKRARLIIREKLWKMWRRHQSYKQFRNLMITKDLPKTLADWQKVLDRADGAIRRVGMYEEYRYPGTYNIMFYRHALTSNCTFEMPPKMRYLDEQAAVDAVYIKKHGATPKQIALAIRLQAMWRGFKVRSYTKYVEKAIEICLTAETRYLSNPEIDVNLYNYALYCLAIQQNLDRARRIFIEALRRMQYRGPDIAFVLYSYSIFALVSHDEDIADIMLYIERAKRAEVHREAFLRKKYYGEETDPDEMPVNFHYGKVYNLASMGFFRNTAISTRTPLAWENYALCRFLVYNDFPGSFDAFMEAFKEDPASTKLKLNFDIMMTHFHGPSKKKHDEVVKQRMRYHAQLDADEIEVRRVLRVNAETRASSARRIQKWYAKYKGLKVFNKFMSNVRSGMADRSRSRRRPDIY